MSTTEHQFGFTTRQLHSGYDPEITTGSRAVPIYQTTAFDSQSTDCDVNKGLPIHIPKNYSPNDNPKREPAVRWRGHANCCIQTG